MTKKPKQEEVILEYLGDGHQWFNVPARDLTQADIDQLARVPMTVPEILQAVGPTGKPLYRRAAPPVAILTEPRKKSKRPIKEVKE